MSRENRLEQSWIIGRVIFEIGVLHQNHIASSSGEAGPERRAFAAIAGLINDLIDHRRNFFFQKLLSSISGGVVHNADCDALHGRGPDGVSDLLNGPSLLKKG